MTDRIPGSDYRLFAAAFVAVAGSAVFGLVSALLPRSTDSPFAYQFVVYSTPMAAILLGGVIGHYIENARRQRVSVSSWFVIAVATLGVGTACYFIAQFVTPTLGRLETPVLFPGLYLIGLAGGFFEAKIPKFRPDRKLRERTSFEVVVEISNPSAVGAEPFKRRLLDQYSASLEQEPHGAVRMRVLFKGTKALRHGVAQIRQIAQQNSLSDAIHITRP